MRPKLRIFVIDYYRSLEAQNMAFRTALVHRIICAILNDRGSEHNHAQFKPNIRKVLNLNDNIPYLKDIVCPEALKTDIHGNTKAAVVPEPLYPKRDFI